MKRAEPTLLGSEIIELLVPHRRPFLMVDAIEAFDRGAMRLRARRHLSANEPVFDGHFPGLHIWPGVYTIEGMGQSCLLLSILAALDDEALDGLKNLQLGYRLHPGFKPQASSAVLERLGPAEARMGFGAAVDVKLLAPVFAGQRLDYVVTRTHVVDDLVRFDVAAEVGGQPVARGTMTGKGGVVVPPGAAGRR